MPPIVAGPGVFSSPGPCLGDQPLWAGLELWVEPASSATIVLSQITASTHLSSALDGFPDWLL